MITTVNEIPEKPQFLLILPGPVIVSIPASSRTNAIVHVVKTNKKRHHKIPKCIMGQKQWILYRISQNSGALS